MPPRTRPAEPPAPRFYIAARPLPVGTEMGADAAPARAFNRGDPVPEEHVRRFGWEPYVYEAGEEPPPLPEDPAAAARTVDPAVQNAPPPPRLGDPPAPAAPPPKAAAAGGVSTKE